MRNKVTIGSRTIFFLLAFALFSLAGCGRYSLSRRMERFMAKPIVLPDGLIRIHGSQIDTGVTLSPPYYIVYVDSMDCSTCRIDRLYEYDWVQETAAKQGGYTFVLIIHPANGERQNVRRALSNPYRNFGFPVYLDNEGRFRNLNGQMALDRRFNAFLTDEKGSPVLVGDVTRSDKLKELFLQQIL